MAKKKNKKIFYLVVIFMTLVFSLIFNTSFNFIKEKVDRNLLPVQSKIFSVSFYIEKLKNLKYVIEENEKLKLENMKLKEKISTFENIKKENKRLVEVLEIKEKYKEEKEIKVARIIYKNIHNLYNKVHVDLGENQGAELNMAVVYDNILLGKITKVFEDYSEVELTTNPKMTVSVKTNREMLGIVEGNDESAGEMYFQPSVFEDTIKEGDELFTSGISNIYPEGLRVGKIIKVAKDENYLFKSIEVIPEYKIKDLREVIIFKYKNK